MVAGQESVCSVLPVVRDDCERPEGCSTCRCNKGRCVVPPVVEKGEVVKEEVSPTLSRLYSVPGSNGKVFTMKTIVDLLHIRMESVFRCMTIKEDESGELIIHSGLFGADRASGFKALLSCQELQPCNGDCEACPAG